MKDYFVGEEVVIKNANKDAELFTHNNEELAKVQRNWRIQNKNRRNI